MFVTTFYSFKGGVGRTMALANVAVELAQSGRRVLMVDFDLEAPGLDTLALPKPSGEHAGVVDYVTDYLASDESPDVGKYIYEAAGVGRQEGRLYVMPAGKRERGYAERFNDIDWANLYAEHEGYLMFEDLKAQWKTLLAPDYVLIDSRTGHTDVSGICTRHLPDAVLIFFIPNEQNLRGLERIVPDIREEASTGRRKEIELLFVMSNVPDLDDEEEILADRRRQFAKSLKIDVRGDRLQIIHRYDSLHLLNQAIFTKDKPKSRLAHEYQRLTRKLMSMNPEDKEGALEFIRQLRTGRSRVAPAEAERRIAVIDERHPEDTEILHVMASLRKEQGRWIEASQLFDGLVKLGHPTSETLLERAEVRLNLGITDGIAGDVLRVLKDPTLDYYKVDRAIRVLRAVDERALLGVGTLPAITSQPPEIRVWIGQHLRRSQVELTAGLDVFRSLLSDPGPGTEQVKSARSELAFNMIGLHDAAAALEQIATNGDATQEASLMDRFNGAMAKWAVEGVPSLDAFARVFPDAQPDVADVRSANHLQCLAVTNWAIGRHDEATQLVYRARNAATLTVGNHISCWRYLDVPTDVFLDDLAQLLSLIEGKNTQPAVVREVYRGSASGVV
jgi:MinD-like ATPase involved in chromosome partitioning or flagellar assembly